ncbi:hypothetical protein B1T49_03700 [Mycobacterium persicum]|nr:hypothetical protein B1T49_03700 [Mycobacterium persicum]
MDVSRTVAADASCRSCGSAVAATAKFCSECGEPLTRSARSAEYASWRCSGRRPHSKITRCGRVWRRWPFSAKSSRLPAISNAMTGWLCGCGSGSIRAR